MLLFRHGLIVGRFGELIRRVQAKLGERAVVLVDEYDKPILDNLTRPDAAREIRDGLRNLYSVIKDSDAHIRFAFLTGVSKFFTKRRSASRGISGDYSRPSQASQALGRCKVAARQGLTGWFDST